MHQVAEEIARRPGSIFLRDKDWRRPVYGWTRKSKGGRTGGI
jgi:hypothetical protein